MCMTSLSRRELSRSFRSFPFFLFVHGTAARGTEIQRDFSEFRKEWEREGQRKNTTKKRGTLSLCCFFFFPFLGDAAKDGIVAGNAGSDLVIVLLGVADGVELAEGGEHRTTEPDGKALQPVRDDVDVDRLGLEAALAQALRLLNAEVDRLLNVALQATAKVLEHGRAARQDNVLHAHKV